MSKIKGCILPWVHMMGGLTGKYYPCCFVEYEDNTLIMGDHSDKILDVWNGDAYKQLRTDFLSNDIPDVCQRACYNKEAHNDISNRLQANNRWADKAGLQQDTAIDGSVDNTPIYLDIRFGNTCNFKCRTCGPHSSTSWYADALSYNKIPDYYTDNDALWSSLPIIVPNIEEVYFAGGEPLVQEGHYKLLLYLISSGFAKDIILNYNSNLSYTKYKQHDIKTLWNNFKKVSVWPSIDGWGTRLEYTRKGISINKLVENLQFYKSYISTISCVISIYSITSMPDFILWAKANNFNYHGTTLSNPENQKVTCLPKEAKKHIIDLYKAFCVKHSDILTTEDYKQIKAWLSSMLSVDDSNLLPAFKEEQLRLDKLRNESFSTTYPEYASWFNSI